MKTNSRCPICKQKYSGKNRESPHHIYPKRFFGLHNSIYYLCQSCHNKLECFIPLETKLKKKEYDRILKWFIFYFSPF